MNDTMETTDVLIVGCGPTGALLTALLGKFEVQNIVLEKQPDITDDPRGISLDEDAIRLLQEFGLYNKIYTEMGSRELYFPLAIAHSRRPPLTAVSSSTWYGTFHD
jgi:2-polyprenyl-6-methoxyphenol hydroxylase-like FAD-dependent oxidoreductase